MKILVLGGTRFLGRSIVQLATERGHDVTIFNRGHHARDLFPQIRKLRGDRNSDIGSLRGEAFEAAVDTSAYLPGAVRSVAEVLGARVQHYTFVSTVAVYNGIVSGRWTEDSVVRAANEAEVERGEGIEVGEIAGESYGSLYGPLKVSCERVVRREFNKALIVRPGLVVGPWDFGGDRFAYWPRRVSEGGDVLAPGDPDSPLQLVDVRDLAGWIIHMIEGAQAGTYNAVGEQLTMSRLLADCRLVTGSRARFVWVDDDFLTEAGVRPMELPLWAPKATKETLFSTSNQRAKAAGLSLRPLTETIAATLSWERENPQRCSFRREREQEIVTAWNRRFQPE